MKVLVFGAQGMLGNALMGHLGRNGFAVRGTTLADQTPVDGVIASVDITSVRDVERAFAQARPDVAINCAGIVKSECYDHERVMAVNGRAPHAMADIARVYEVRFVQISTDCVFSGNRSGGGYREADPVDADDLYGQSKAAGEIADRRDCLTIRTSFIGRDARRRRGLLEWLAMQSVAPGYACVRWSGLAAPELARAIVLALTRELSGLYHVAGPAISKAELLELLMQTMGLRCRVERVDEPVIDRTLDGSRFTEATGYAPPTWAAMAQELSRHA